MALAPSADLLAADDLRVDPITFEIVRHRLWAALDEAAATLVKTAGSPSITEARDFMVALFTAEGEIAFAGWGANRAATYGVKEEDLGQFYANRTILKREVVPENVADAVYVLTGPELSRTTGLHIPVDSGVAAAFLR